MDIALATCATLPELFRDDQLLADLLRNKGLDARPLIWTSEEARTVRPKACVIRNTWDYHHRREAFLGWASSMEGRCPLFNPCATIHWNSHKGYLQDLACHCIPVVPTLWVKRESPMDVIREIAATGWKEVVVKPAVSAGAHRTVRLPASAGEEIQRQVQFITLDADVMVQPYLPSVEGYGERSFLFVDGLLTHAVKRPPALTMGTCTDRDLERVEPTGDERQLAEAVMAALPWPVLYGRVDLAPGPDGMPLLMELELIEPRMFFTEAPEAAERLAQALVRKVAAG